MDIFWDDDDEYNSVVALVVQEVEVGEDDILMLMEDVIPDPVARVFGSESRTGKAPNVDRRCVFYSHLLVFQDFWVILQSTIRHTSRCFQGSNRSLK
jgi:hypothetical protein